MNTDDWPKISRKSNMSFQKEVGQNLKNKQTNKQTKKTEIKYLGTEAGLGEEVVNEEKLADNSKPSQISDSGELWDPIEQHNQGKEKQKQMTLTVITSREKAQILLSTIIEVGL